MVTNGDIRLFTQSLGRPEDPAILLVMGATASMLWWPDALCQALSDAGYYVIRYDHRDTGQSSVIDGANLPYSLDDMAGDALSVLDAYGIAKAHWVGMSLGGLISQIVAFRYPARVQSLTLIASEPLGGEPVEAPNISPEFMSHFSELANLDWTDRNASASFLMKIAELSASPERGPDVKQNADRIANELARAETMATAFNHAAIDADLGQADLRKLTQPTLVIHGAHDPVIVLAKGQAIAEQIPNARLVILPESGHELHGDDLDHIEAEIIQHIAIS